MTFTSLTFLIFLAIVFAVYWLLKEARQQNIALILASYLFYGWWDWRFCFLMFFSSLVDYIIGILLGGTEKKRIRIQLLLISLVCNLGLLGFFKYFNFFSDSFVKMAALVGLKADPLLLQIILPVGISFYTFQTLSYTIDVYRRKCPICHDPLAFFAFVSFFPQLVAGPIERASHLLPQMINSRSFNYAKAVDGSRQILWGFFKKLVIADALAGTVNKYYSSARMHSGPVMLYATFCFAFQIYCDFSAYSDIAVGAARLFGIDLMRNFAYPYFSRNISDFWRRWHISLSTWFRDYVYIPLGGSRCTRRRSIFNLIATFILSGLWHGAAWHFVAWGAINGVAVAAYNQFVRPKDRKFTVGWRNYITAPLAIVITFAVILMCWVFFRAEDIPSACNIIYKVVTGLFYPAGWTKVMNLISLKLAFWVVFLLFVIIEFIQRRQTHPLALTNRMPRAARWIIYWTILFLIFFIGATPSELQTFIYFQF